MNVQLKNITGSPLSLIDSTLIIQNISSIAASATVTISSPIYEVWQDAVLRAAVNANQAEIYINSSLVPKGLALAMFDNPQTSANWAIQTTVSTATAFTPILQRQIFCDATAAGGTATIALNDPATVPAGRLHDFILTSAGTMNVSCFTGSSFLVNGVAIGSIATKGVGDVIRVVSNGTKWVVILPQTMRGLIFDGIIESPTQIVPTVTVNKDNWDLLTVQYPLKSSFRLDAGGNRQITGLIPRDATRSEVIEFIVSPNSAGNFAFKQNNAASAVGNRFLIGTDENVSAGRPILLKYLPSPILGWVMAG